MNLHNADRFQPEKPDRYRLPPVVQPNWRLRDLEGALRPDKLDRLTDQIRSRYGVRYCVLLDRARSGLFLLAKLRELSGEWLLTSIMHRPTAVLLRQYCAGLAFVDVRSDFTVDPASVERMITAGSRALVATHTYGKAADVRTLRRLADRNNLFLIENAVHLAGGASVDGRLLGSWGDAAILSFNVDKPLGAILGGALLTNREDVWRSVSSQPLSVPNTKETWDRIFSTYLAYRLKPAILRLGLGQSHRAASDSVNETEAFRLDSYATYQPRAIHNLQATIALNCFLKQDNVISKRQHNAEKLSAALRDIRELQLPESTAQQPHTFTYYPIMLGTHDRLELGSKLAQLGIETKWRYPPLHLQRDFSDIRRDTLPITEIIWRKHLLLPAGPWSNDSQIDYLANALHSLLP